MNVVIIEDEPLMAEELAEEISKVDDSIRIAAVCPSVREALSYLSEHGPPDLFFSDVQLSDGLSFEIFSQMETLVPVIFCTAFDEYALQAFRANGIDYILKPFDNEIIKETLDKHRHLTGQKDANSDLTKLLNFMEHRDAESKKSLVIQHGPKIYAIKYMDLRVVYLKDGMTYVVAKDGKKYPVNLPLERIEKELDDHFYRVNRQVIIHRDAIAHIDNYFARKLLITPSFEVDSDVIVSKASATQFLHWLAS
ncbi:MAG: LytTR family DNA-binding domain-containing protein [Bacteroidota bacterium]